MTKVVLVVLMFFSSMVYALDSTEFQMYGIAANGRVFDVRPYGKSTTTEGDVSEPYGLHGEFFELIGNERGGRLKSVGSCRIVQKDLYRFSCEPGNGVFAGVVYEGQPISDAKLHPEATKLYQSFVRKYKYGSIAALYRCTDGCDAKRPVYLIFVWRGD